MNPAQTQLLVDAINQLQDVVTVCSYVIVYALGFLSGIKLISLLPS